MKKNVMNLFLICIVAVSGALFSGCGGGDTTPTPAQSSQGISGVAAAGSPIKGTVTLKDSSFPARLRTTATDSSGSYRLDVNGLQPPFLIKVEWKDGGGAVLQLHSLARAHGRANINPLTDVIVAGAGSNDPALVFDSNDPAAIEAAAARLMAALESLRTVLAPMLRLYGCDKDPIEDDLEDGHTGYNDLFDDVRIYVASGMIIVRNKRTNGLIFSAPINDIASGTFYENNLPVRPGTLDGAALYADKCASCHGDLSASGEKGASAAAIQSAISNNRGGMGSLASLTTDQIAAIAAALATTSTPPAACTYTYSPWAACQSNSTQTRTVAASAPAGCTGTPVLTQPCIPEPSVTACTSFTYSAWGACQSNNTQTRTVATSSPAGCTGGAPLLTQACTFVPPVTACTSFTYSAWGACQSDNTQTRTVATSLPAGCTGGTPVLSQSCTYTPPAPACGSCHAIPPSTGQHSFHVGSLGYQCSTCHGAGYSSTAVTAATHNNGAIDVVNSLGFNATTSTCGSPGCHASRTW